MTDVLCIEIRYDNSQNISTHSLGNIAYSWHGNPHKNPIFTQKTATRQNSFVSSHRSRQCELDMTATVHSIHWWDMCRHRPSCRPTPCTRHAHHV